jgi:hypothetical protein
MSFDLLSDVNWLAVLVGGVGYFALGALWYSPPLFGKAYQSAVGMDPQAQQDMNMAGYLVSLPLMLVTSLAVALLALATGSDTAAEGLNLGLVAGIGISLMLLAVVANYEVNDPKPWTLFWINGSYHTLGVIGLAILHALWR